MLIPITLEALDLRPQPGSEGNVLMRFSPTETRSPERDIARERSVVHALGPDSTPRGPARVPFSPADGPVIVARGILEDELAHARAVVAVH